MTEIEYQEFVRHCPYDAMGDYSMFRKEQTENKSECTCKSRISQAIWQTNLNADTCVTKESRTPVQKKRVSS